ncbi:MAG TPA: hypothetical protein VGN08_06235 [Solirubrobacteraceae bacterium]
MSPAVEEDLGLVVPVDAKKADRDVGVPRAECSPGGRELIADEEADRQGCLTAGDVLDPAPGSVRCGQQRLGLA